MASSIEESKKTSEQNKNELMEKIDGVNKRLESVESRIDELFEENDNLGRTIETNQASASNEIQLLRDQISTLEEKIVTLETLPKEIDDLKELTEERTNRQLRETLVFKNVPETLPDETFADTKDILAKLIGDICDIPVDDVAKEIKRAHRESKRRNQEDHYRKGKRLIFAAMHSWDLCQTIIEKFKMMCLQDANYISAILQYGPITSKRRRMALQKRKELKDNGTIASGYIEFPAKLFVNRVGELDNEGKKLYRLHINYSKYKIDD